MSGSGSHLPPAVCHCEGDGHGRPFTPTGWRLLAVPENDDLDEEREIYLTYCTHMDALNRSEIAADARAAKV